MAAGASLPIGPVLPLSRSPGEPLKLPKQHGTRNDPAGDRLAQHKGHHPGDPGAPGAAHPPRGSKEGRPPAPPGGLPRRVPPRDGIWLRHRRAGTGGPRGVSPLLPRGRGPRRHGGRRCRRRERLDPPGTEHRRRGPRRRGPCPERRDAGRQQAWRWHAGGTRTHRARDRRLPRDRVHREGGRKLVLLCRLRVPDARYHWEAEEGHASEPPPPPFPHQSSGIPSLLSSSHSLPVPFSTCYWAKRFAAPEGLMH